MSEFPPRYPSVPTLTTNRTPVGNTDANQKPMLIDDFSTNEPPLSWMMFEQANLRKQLVELNNQLAEAKAEIVRLREALRLAGNRVEPLASFQQKDIGSSTIRVGEETKFSRDARSFNGEK